MKRTVITLALIASMALPGSTAKANDLIEALARLQRATTRPDRPQRRGYDYAPTGRDVVVTSSRRNGSVYGRTTQDIAAEAARLRAIERAEYLRRLERIAELERLQRQEQLERSRRRGTITHRVRYQEPLPVLPPTAVPVLPNRRPVLIPPAPAFPDAGIGRPGISVPRIPSPRVPNRVLPPQRHHDFVSGDIVDCPVPLYSRLRIRDRHNIACGARPMVVAVRAPGGCHDEVVFVQVMAPPCEPRSITVTPCGRHVRMDFGKYEIDIVSMTNLVKVDYDN